HEAPEREAARHGAARHRARRPPGRPRDRLHHRRPRDARLARCDPLGRPGAARGRRPGRARRRRHRVRGEHLRGGHPRPPARARPVAGAAERSRSPALPRLAADAIPRSRRVSHAAGALAVVATRAERVSGRWAELSPTQFLRAATASLVWIYLVVTTGAIV